MERILVTPRSITKAGGHPGLKSFTEMGYEVVFSRAGVQPSEQDLLELLPGCVGMLAGVEPISATVLESAKGLRVIGRNGVGVDNIDLAAAKRLGVSVVRAVGANARGVAELAFGLMLAGVRSIPFSDTVIKQGGWERRRGIELEGRTLGLVGCGAIGRYMAQFASCIGMQVVAYDVAPDPAFAPGPNFRYAGLDEVLGVSDVVSLHCPSTGQPLLDANAFEKMKAGVYIINTARHDLIDSRALMDALDSGHVAGAALDVFATEPPTGDPLVIHSRVIATPHLGGFTEESIERAVEMAVKGMAAQLTQEKGAK